MIVLDSNVISALMRSPEPILLSWLDQQPAQSVWTTSVCVYEIEYGIQSLPRGKRRQKLHDDFQRALQEDLGDRVLTFDAAAARHAASISAKLREQGRPIDVRDAMIAGTVASRNATLATRTNDGSRKYESAPGDSGADPSTTEMALFDVPAQSRHFLPLNPFSAKSFSDFAS